MIVTNIENKFCKKACKTSLENILQTRIYTEAFPGRQFVETKVKIHQTKTLKTKNFIERNEQKKKTNSSQINTLKKGEKNFTFHSNSGFYFQKVEHLENLARDCDDQDDIIIKGYS